MKLRKSKRPPARFAAGAQLGEPLVDPVPFEGGLRTKIDQLKTRLLRDAMDQATGADLILALRRAANEAAAVASITPYPLLFLPVLFDEKAEAARLYQKRQIRIRKRSAQLMGFSE